MPEIYTRSLSSVGDGSAVWDFENWVPDAVVLNLGTNDIGSGQYNETEFAGAYLALCLNISSAYAVAARGAGVTLFLACGPMSDAYCGGVQLALGQLQVLIVESTGVGSKYTSSTQPLPKAAYFLDQTNLGVSLGCCGHPTAADDQIMSLNGSSVIMESMGWA